MKSIITDVNEIADLLNLPKYDMEEGILYRRDISYAVNSLRMFYGLNGITEDAPNVHIK